MVSLSKQQTTTPVRPGPAFVREDLAGKKRKRRRLALARMRACAKKKREGLKKAAQQRLADLSTEKLIAYGTEALILSEQAYRADSEGYRQLRKPGQQEAGLRRRNKAMDRYSKLRNLLLSVHRELKGRGLDADAVNDATTAYATKRGYELMKPEGVHTEWAHKKKPKSTPELREVVRWIRVKGKSVPLKKAAAPTKWITVKGQSVPLTPAKGKPPVAVEDMALRDFLAGRNSARIGTLTTRDGKTVAVGVKHDRGGTYSLTLRAGKSTESIRMHYRLTETLAEIAKHANEYFNADGDTGTRVVIDAQPKKSKAASGPKTQVDKWKADLKKRKAKKHKLANDETMIEVLQRRINANPDRTKVGYGVGWKATRGQTNRGYAVVAADPPNKVAAIYPVADTGLTEDGGGPPKREVMIVPMGDLVRDKRYDCHADRCTALYAKSKASGPKPKYMG